MIPSRTVTFLFTDIEESTRLWEQHPEAMQQALAHHDSLLRQAIESHRGSVFKTVGDAFCATFDTAPEALAAAITCQRKLLSEDWGETPIRVRMALHTGVAEERDEDYFGPDVNRVARLLSVGHGGQILLSGAAHQLVRNQFPNDVEVIAFVPLTDDVVAGIDDQSVFKDHVTNGHSRTVGKSKFKYFYNTIFQFLGTEIGVLDDTIVKVIMAPGSVGSEPARLFVYIINF